MKRQCARLQPWLPDYAAGDLWGFRRMQLEAHLESCPDCRRELDELTRVVQELQAHPLPEPPPGFWADFDRELHLKLAQLPPAPTPPARPRWKLVLWAAPVLTGLLLWVLGHPWLTPLTDPPGLQPPPASRDFAVQMSPKPAPESAPPAAPAPPKAFSRAAETPVVTGLLPPPPPEPAQRAAPLPAADLAAKVLAFTPRKRPETRADRHPGPLEFYDPLVGWRPEDILGGLSPRQVELVFKRLHYVRGK